MSLIRDFWSPPGERTARIEDDRQLRLTEHADLKLSFASLEEAEVRAAALLATFRIMGRAYSAANC